MVILTNRCIMKLKAPGFKQDHKAAENGLSPTSVIDRPPAEVRWAISWQVHSAVPHHDMRNVSPPLYQECETQLRPKAYVKQVQPLARKC